MGGLTRLRVEAECAPEGEVRQIRKGKAGKERAGERERTRKVFALKRRITETTQAAWQEWMASVRLGHAGRIHGRCEADTELPQGAVRISLNRPHQLKSATRRDPVWVHPAALSLFPQSRKDDTRYRTTVNFCVRTCPPASRRRKYIPEASPSRRIRTSFRPRAEPMRTSRTCRPSTS